MKKALCLTLCALLLAGTVGCSLFQVLDGPGMEYHAPDTPTETPAETPTGPAVPNETTASGWHVATDYSAYAPRDALPAANYTRLSDDPIADLAAGNYGAIFPFAGAPLYSSSEDGYSYLNGRYYGFVTEQGQIVCDPVYTAVSPLRLYDYTEGSTVALPVWTYSRTGEIYTESYTDEDSGEVYEWQEGTEYYGVAALDGSFALPCEYRGVNGFDGGFVCYRSWDRPDFEVYDLQGKLLFQAQDLTFLDLSEYVSVDCSDGVFLLHNNGLTYAADAQGKLLFEPMKDVGAFSNGLAAASLDGVRYGYIDKSGRWVIPAGYDSASIFRNGYATVEQGERRSVIDTSGKVQFTVSGGYLSESGGGYYCFSPRDDSGERYYTADGKLVLEGAPNESWYRLKDDVFYCNDYESDSGVRIRKLSTGKELFVENVGYLYDTRMSEMDPGNNELYYNGQPCYVAQCWIPDPDDEYGGGHYACTFISEDLEILDAREDLDFYTLSDYFTGKLYMLMRRTGSGLRICQDQSGSTVCTLGDDDSLMLMNGWMQKTDVYCARLVDPAGKEVFCYPLLAALED